MKGWKAEFRDEATY